MIIAKHQLLNSFVLPSLLTSYLRNCITNNIKLHHIIVLLTHSSNMLLSTFYVLGLYQILGIHKIDTISPLLKLTERELS